MTHGLVYTWGNNDEGQLGVADAGLQICQYWCNWTSVQLYTEHCLVKHNKVHFALSKYYNLCMNFAIISQDKANLIAIGSDANVRILHV
jgi:alpha-tubulin suppressor-like RCC1 family protein